MAKPEYLSLSKRIIDRLSVDDKDTVFWDRDLPGFGDGYFLQPSKRRECFHNQLIINGNLITTQARRGRP